MNKILLSSMFAIVSIGALAAMGIITNFPLVKADVVCNPSDGCQPPGHSSINNPGQCQKTFAERFGKELAHEACH
ncbi:MAG TPA: hypothetical protein VN703_03360 [Candidatus Sulfopaludibacter sp.]|jgi:hypothetical protein|nr:hypothetical protein [Candidatus Sulfopaludibacter sp.]